MHICFSCFFTLLFLHCNTQKNHGESSNIKHIQIVWSSIIKNKKGIKEPIIDYRCNVFYSDSFALEEQVSINSVTNNGVEIITFPVEKYRFVNFNKRKIYEYYTLEDTAQLLRTYSYDDSIEVVSGWGFNFNHYIPYQKGPFILNDTIIENINYKKRLVIEEFKTNSFYKELLFRVDKPIHPLSYDSSLSQQVGFPLTRIHILDKSTKEVVAIDEIRFLASKDIEYNIKKAFAKWQREHNQLLLPIRNQNPR